MPNGGTDGDRIKFKAPDMIHTKKDQLIEQPVKLTVR
jgi:hypothetical protein